MTTESTGVVFDGVTKAFGASTVLSGIDLDLQPGELVTVLGPSGCGKTTALRILAGFETPDRGRVRIGRRDVTAVAPNRRGIGMVFQAYSLFPNLSVIDNVEYGLRIRRVARAAGQKRAGELLEMCGLSAFAGRFPHQLSGGQQQRVALARALAVEPAVLLLDEPLSALDATVRVQIREEIQRLQRELGITTMFVTHDQAEALAIADRVAVMRAGRIEQLAAPQEVYRRPATEFVARFVGTVSAIDWSGGDRGGADGGSADWGGDDRSEGDRGGARALVRPEDLEFTPDAAGGFVVTGQSYTGERTIIRARRLGDAGGSDAGGHELVSSAFLSQAERLPVGARVSWRLTGEPAFVTGAAGGAAASECAGGTGGGSGAAAGGSSEKDGAVDRRSARISAGFGDKQAAARQNGEQDAAQKTVTDERIESATA